MSYSNQPIHVVAGADDNYAMPLAVLMCSVLKNLNSETILYFYILDGGVSKDSRNRLINVFKNHGSKENHNLEWVKPDLSVVNNLPANGKPPSIYLPLLIPDLLPSNCKKAVFLDCDLILESNIQKLWDHTFDDAAIWAVRDVLIQTLSDPKGVATYKNYGGTADSPYFNSGVILINLDYWRKEKITEKAIDYLLKNGDSMYHCDQEALNAIFIEKWKELDPRWNQQGCVFWPQVLPESEFTESIMSRYHDLVNNPFIIHYLSPSKPWDYKCMHPFVHRFLFYLKESGWFTRKEWTIWWYKLYYKRLKWLFGDLRRTLNMIRFKKNSSHFQQ